MPNYKPGQKIFPTDHPFKNLDGSPSVSNVRLGSYGFDEGTRVIPTMVGGENLGTVGGLQRARAEGLDKYPLFKTKAEAEEFIRLHHGNIDAKGRFMPKLKK